ncbi:MAG: multiheme c-type cytochrome [Phaeodactylibacter sp.]|uniref:tetratricopeptide repeat protein n=1 Tax=Phaeodactylibacter sp. TaxID=1940289 RepID=UPI0032ED8505
MQTCKSCHADVHSTFIHTGMGRSFDRATLEKTDATFGEHAVVYDEASDLHYKPFFRDSQMYVLEYRLEGADTVHQRLEQIDYIVGSGQHTNSHIVDFNGYLYQAPVTYYTQEGKWDMAPGFRGDNIRFSRLLSAECITCHNHLPEQVPGSMNKYTKMPTGIACERCHGPGEIHVKEKLAGDIVDTSKWIDYSIVNPRDLSRDLQMDLCQRCHLQGIAVLQEGKSFYDFKPGMPLNEVVNVFLPRYTDSHEKFIMASQADRLRLSACYLNSEMTCITCHNPHKSIAVTGKEQYNNACKNCHDSPEESRCAFPIAERLAEGNDCSGCHMPRSGSIDIPHVNITDHYISKGNTRGAEKPKTAGTTAAFLGLEILTKDQGTALELAQGYLAMYDKYVQSPMVLDSAWAYLQQSQAPAEKQFPVEVHYFFAREDYASILQRTSGISPSEVGDGWTAYRIGEAFYQAGDFQRAAAFYRRADEWIPYHLDFKEKLGATLVQLRQLPEAEEALRWVLQENPKRPRALSNLGFARVLQGHTKEAEVYYDQAIALEPDYIQALLNKAAVRLLHKDYTTVQQLLGRILKLDPEHPQALAILQQLNH